MPTFRRGTVLQLLSERPGIQRVLVAVGGGAGDGGHARAYALTELTGSVAVGDEVILNTTAVELGLGTGGWHVVHWNLSRDELVQPGPDHIMKLRYSSLQADTGAAEAQHPDAVERRLGGRPVVACTVHSQVALVALGFAAAAPGRRLAYVMTDGAALPIVISDLVDSLSAHGLLAGTVTVGHAFGGDLEAVSIAGGLGLAAHVLDADAIVVGMGPGVVGTGTRLGTTALEAAHVLDVAAARGATPVLCVRVSDADRRDRHRGVSHHVAGVLDLCSAHPWVAPVPESVATLAGVRVADPAWLGEVPEPADLLERAALRVTTMGRDHTDDDVFFRAGIAAGVLAGRFVAVGADGVAGSAVRHSSAP